MSTLPDLLRRAKRVAKRRNWSTSTVSKRLFNDHRRLDAVASGRSFLRPPTLAKAFAVLQQLEGETQEGGSRRRPGKAAQ
jgi:hypothetical protein